MNAYQPYPAYKDSGVEWLDQIPAHWDVRRLKIAIKTAINGIWGDVPQENNDDLICVRVADFNYDMLGVSTDNLTIRNIPASKQSYRILSNQDLLIEKSGGGDIWPVGRLVSYNLDIKAVCSNFIARLSVNGEISSRFICYVFASTYSIGLNTRSIKQTTGIQNLDLQAYLNEKIAFPPYSEQRAIAAYLDRETAHIDALIARKRELIDLLHRQRTAVISHAVTKGLDAQVPLRDSGVEWLGEIPAHWEVLLLRRVTKRVKTGCTPAGARSSAFQENGWNWFTPGDFSGSILLEKSSRTLSEEGLREVPVFPENTVYLVGIGATIGKVGLSTRVGSCNQQIHGIVVGDSVNSKFIAYSLSIRHEFIVKCGKYTTLPIINQDETKSLIFVRPPLAEQLHIAAFLDHETARIDHLISEIEASIELLRQQRTALISAAVTGRIDVRGQA
jgi:type I restriction enzyme, S subunit